MDTGVLNADQATHIQIEDYLGLVVHIAKRYVRSYLEHHILDLDDLVQEGVIGLMHAAEKFDAQKGFRFSNYATWWVRKLIVEAIMNQSRTMRLPSPIWYALQRLTRMRATLWQQYQREPSPDELAEAMQCEKEHVLLLLQLQQELVSLEQPIFSENEDVLLADLLEAPDDTEQREQQAVVADLLEHLSPRERQVIEARYQLGQTGTYGVEDIPLPYTEVSRQLGMTTELVTATEKRAFMQLRFWAERAHLYEKP